MILVTQASAQCPHERGSGTRCELPVGHDSAHRACIDDEVILSWVNHDAEHSRATSYDDPE